MNREPTSIWQDMNRAQRGSAVFCLLVSVAIAMLPSILIAFM